MKATELMLGDWVSYGDYCVGMVMEIKNSQWLIEATNKAWHWLSEGITSPIPLTEEMLQENFPTSEIICWYPDGDTFRIIVTKSDGDMAINLRYVHELQHIIKICGIDKEIVL